MSSAAVTGTMRTIGIMLVMLPLLAGCGRSGVRPSNQTPVIVISIDTLRSDHLPAYGYRGVETPHIDAFRSDAVLFQRAYSHVPLTLPSHATMFTGTLPAENGARDNIGFHIAPTLPTIPELLKKNGYATGGAVSAFVLRHETGMSRGFDEYDDQIDPANSGTNVGRVQRDGGETAAIAKKWIETRTAKPFFYFLHLYEPHTPYTPPEPFLSRYPSHYDGEIARADAIVGDFLAFLKEKKIYDDALIILLSDHGEGLGDHGETEHGLLLNREALQVPLIVKFPRNAMKGSDVETPVPLSDLFPTIAAVTATPVTTKAISLLDTAAGKAAQRDIYSETYFPRFHYGWSDMHSLIRGTDHYIQAPKPELYDLAADPAEKRNLATDDRRKSFALREAIAPLIQQAAAPTPVSAEETRKLAALGYIGSTAPQSGGDLADPKDKLAVAGDMRRAFTLYEQGKYEEALPLLQALVAENDRMLDVWDILSRTLDRLGQTEAAIDAAKRAFRLSPNTTHLALMIAALSIDARRLDEAEKHAELALESEPGRAHDLIARVHLARGDVAGAEREAKLALETRDQIFPLMTLGRIEMDRKHFDLALSYADRAAAFLESKKGSAVKGLNFLRGDALARLGRTAEAEQAFRKEIDLFPRDPQAYKNLILLCVSDGRNDEATRLVFQLIEKAPTPPSYAAISTTLKTVGDDRGARYWAIQGLKKFPSDATLRKMAAS